jgi:hypothetical protein
MLWNDVSSIFETIEGIINEEFFNKIEETSTILKNYG